jgi:hypothetical protein
MLLRTGAALSLAALLGCEAKRPAPAPAASTAASAGPSAHAPPAPSARSEEKDEPPLARHDGGAIQLSDVGPAGPATATAHGVVMVTKDDQIALARFGKQGALEPVTTAGDAFHAASRGPAVAGDFAYWTARGQLVRRKLAGGVRQSLADDARDGTRVAAAIVGAGKSARAVAAYIANAGDATAARLWIERVGTWTLTPEGAAASSVALAVSGTDAVVVALEGRTGMTPVHARVTDFASATPTLKEDVVVWVAGPAQPLTEIVAVDQAGSIWAFLPLERDITRFGMAQIEIGPEPKMGAGITWRAYPNGADPAPIAAASACQGAAVLYAVPAEAKPGAPQELHLAAIEAGGLGAAQVIARSRAFSNVSLAEAPSGVLVSYVADHRTWATVVRCPPRG